MKSEPEHHLKRRSRLSCYICSKFGRSLMNCSYCNRYFHKECAEQDKEWDTGTVFCTDCERRVNEPSP